MQDDLTEKRKEIRRLSKELRIICIERNRIERIKWNLWESLYSKKKALGRLKAEKCPALKFREYGREETGKCYYAECSLRAKGGAVYTGQTKENPYSNFCWMCALTPEEAGTKKVFKKIGG